jgi:hypothetical protein
MHIVFCIDKTSPSKCISNKILFDVNNRPWTEFLRHWHQRLEEALSNALLDNKNKSQLFQAREKQGCQMVY